MSVPRKRLDHAAAFDLWMRGVPSHEIALRLTTTANTIRDLAHRQQWPKRERAHNRQSYRAIWATAEALWREGVPVAEIARRINYKKASSVRHLALRLGWPKRSPNRDTTKATAKMREIVAARCRAGAADQLERCEAYLAAERQPMPRWYRCPHCGGRATRPHGHEGCQQVAA